MLIAAINIDLYLCFPIGQLIKPYLTNHNCETVHAKFGLNGPLFFLTLFVYLKDYKNKDIGNNRDFTAKLYNNEVTNR